MTSMCIARLLFINDTIIDPDKGELLITGIDKGDDGIVVIEADGPGGTAHTIAVRAASPFRIKGH